MSDQNLQIYIRGFPKTTKQDDLRTAFQKFGTIKQARIINAYAFIGFQTQDAVKKAVQEMNQSNFDGAIIKVEIAGKPKKQKGPQPHDQCRFCKKLGHWKNDCPEYRRNYRDRDDRRRRRRSRSRSRSRSSSSSSSESDHHKYYLSNIEKKRTEEEDPHPPAIPNLQAHPLEGTNIQNSVEIENREKGIKRRKMRMVRNRRTSLDPQQYELWNHDDGLGTEIFLT